MRRSVVRLLFCTLFCSLSITVVAQSSGENLGEIARKYRDQQKSAPVVKPSDAKALFREMDSILDFASSDTGFAKPATVNRKLLSRADLKAMYGEAFSKSEDTEDRLLNSELVLKKFGLLRPDFNFAKYMREDVVNQFAGLYDSRTKTMYLMDWVPMEKQKEIMAHELTHALQDKNFDLRKFKSLGASNAKKDESELKRFRVGMDDDSERRVARHAVVEGQAMLVLVDYEIEQYPEIRGLSSADRYRIATNFIQQSLLNYDMRISMPHAPRILADTLEFPYREGLAFELELTRRNRRSAFVGVFERPPRSTHEVLEPEAYFNHEDPAVVVIPDLTPLLQDAYIPYDSGVMGEFDIYVMAKEWGRENDIYSVAQKWKGGSYIVARRKPTDSSIKPTVADLALLYVSRWRTPEAAVRFGEIYRNGLKKHASVSDEASYDATCSLGDDKCKGMQWGIRLETDEGLVSIELWQGNTLIVSHSFADETLSKMRRVLLTKPAVAQKNSVEPKELSMKLYDLPEFVALQESYSQQVIESVVRALQ